MVGAGSLVPSWNLLMISEKRRIQSQFGLLLVIVSLLVENNRSRHSNRNLENDSGDLSGKRCLDNSNSLPHQNTRLGDDNGRNDLSRKQRQPISLSVNLAVDC